MRKYFIISLIVLSAAGCGKQPATPPPATNQQKDIFVTQEECAKSTGGQCVYVVCPTKTFNPKCPSGSYWTPAVNGR